MLLRACLAGVSMVSLLNGCSGTANPNGMGDGAVDASDASLDNETDALSPPADTRADTPGDGSLDGDGSATGAVAITCPADASVMFTAAISACVATTDCTIAVHGLDCCGSEEIVGINQSEQSAFGAAETQCEAAVGFDMCQCLARAPIAQDGQPVPTAGMPRVTCVEGVCLTFGQ